jgi:hypothetical protein
MSIAFFVGLSKYFLNEFFLKGDTMLVPFNCWLGKRPFFSNQAKEESGMPTLF